MKTKHFTAFWLCSLLAAGPVISCGNRQEKEKQISSTALPVQPDSVTQTTGGTPPSVSTDEQKFRTAVSALQQAVQGDNQELVKSLIRFPLHTGKQGPNEDLKRPDIGKAAGIVNAGEFEEYYPKIFHAGVKQLLPEAGEENFSEIDERTGEDHFRTLQQGTDKDTKLYEVSMQHPGKNGTAGNYFTFVFGSVQGQYKVIGYYSK